MKFFKENVLGIFLLSVTASLVASHIYEQTSLENMIKPFADITFSDLLNALPYIVQHGIIAFLLIFFSALFFTESISLWLESRASEDRMNGEVNFYGVMLLLLFTVWFYFTKSTDKPLIVHGIYTFLLIVTSLLFFGYGIPLWLKNRAGEHRMNGEVNFYGVMLLFVFPAWFITKTIDKPLIVHGIYTFLLIVTSLLFFGYGIPLWLKNRAGGDCEDSLLDLGLYGFSNLFVFIVWYFGF